ncbi:MAG: M4 family metallopeptidase [Anaerohalosphaeraceae bacterium]
MKRLFLFNPFHHSILTGVLVGFWITAGLNYAKVPEDAYSRTQQDIERLCGTICCSDQFTVQQKQTMPSRMALRDGYIRILGAPRGYYFPVSGFVAQDPIATARNFLEEHGDAFGIQSKSIAFTSSRSTKHNNRTVERLQQTYSQVPVFMAQVNVQLNASGGVEYVLSDIMRTPHVLEDKKISTIPTIAAEDAEFLAMEFMTETYPSNDLDCTAAELVIYHPEIIGNSGPTRLVWKTDVTGVLVPTINELVMIDAHTGEVALHFTQIRIARNRQIYDAINTTSDPGILRRSENGATVNIADVDTCYAYFGDTYNFYYNEHGRDSINHAGMILSATVRYCPSYSDCPYANAFWNGLRMYFGAGFVCDDIVAHELTHGVTQYESNLIYQNESGAISEALSDMWGEWIDLTNGAGNDSASVRWLVGEDIPNIGAIRNMADPTAFEDPDRKGSPFWYSGGSDNGGVHTNCGVGNKLCSLLTDGGTFNGKTVTGMGISAVADLFYEVQTALLTGGSDYADLHDALTQAAINLGWTAANRTNLENACLATELSYVPASPPNDECVNAITITNGVSVNGTTVHATGIDITSCTYNDASDVWYSYTPSVGGNVTVSLCGSSYDTALSIFSACSGSQLTCNDDACDYQSQISMEMTAGTAYLIRVSGYGNEKGDFVLTVTSDGIGNSAPVAESMNTTIAANTSESIVFRATDDGLPDPPAALSYLITSLPSHGELNDPEGGIISTVPCTLVNDGNRVIYTPDASYLGADSFQFMAYDGSSNSSAATVSLQVTSSQRNVIYAAAMDSSPNWTYTNGWQWGTPAGAGGISHGYPDPASGYTGSHVVGFNLTGDYANDIGSTLWVTTPAVNCSMNTDVILTFYRWLNVERAEYDHAYIQISSDGSTWTTLWENPEGYAIMDSGWKQQVFDISAVADNQPHVYIRWGLGPTDSSFQFSGWNIDDVRITGTIAPVRSVIYSQNFENGPGAFTVNNTFGNGSGLWHWTAGCHSTLPGHSLPAALGYCQDGTCGYDTGNSEGVITSPEISLLGVTDAGLEFKYLLETEQLARFDIASVEISQNGGAFKSCRSNAAATLQDPSDGWTTETVDLTSMDQSTIRLRFRFQTVDAQNNAFPGFYIDDIVVTGVVEPTLTMMGSLFPDFNGDNKNDLVWRNVTSGTYLGTLMDGLTPGLTRNFGGSNTTLQLVGLADFNADGKTDLLWRNVNTGACLFTLMDGLTLGLTRNLGGSSTTLQLAGLADFNADGKTDLLWRNVGTGAYLGAVMDGSTALEVKGLGGTSETLQIVGLVDFDNDDKTDLVWRNINTGAYLGTRMNGLTMVQTKGLGGGSTTLQIADFADFNADGMSDILWRNVNTGAYIGTLMNGLTIVQTRNLSGSSTTLQIAGLADLNADNMADLIWRNVNTGSYIATQMNGLTMVQNKSLGGSRSTLQIADFMDFNADGMSDILWRNVNTGAFLGTQMNGLTIVQTKGFGGSSTTLQILTP